MTRCSCWLLCAALRVVPWSRAGWAGMASWQDRTLVSPQEVNTHSPGSPFVKKQDLCSAENKWEEKNPWVDDAFKGPEYLWICTVTLKLFLVALRPFPTAGRTLGSVRQCLTTSPPHLLWKTVHALHDFSSLLKHPGR